MTSAGIDYARSRVILLGTSVYHNGDFEDVPAVKHSMQGMYAMLTSPRHGGWPKDRVTPWLDRSDAGAVARELRDLAMATEGVFIFYFAGHGVTFDDGGEEELCLMLPDATLDAPYLDGLELTMVSRALDASDAQTKLLILDCCYAHAASRWPMGDVGAPVLDSTPGTYMLAATNPLQRRAKWSGKDDRTPTAFTGELLNLIHTGQAEGPDWLSLNDFYPSLRQRLTERELPRPSNEASDMAVHQPFTRNAALPGPDGAAITPPPFFAANVPDDPGTGGPLRVLAAALLLPFSSASAFRRRAARRFARLAPRTQWTALVIAVLVAGFAAYALTSGTSIGSSTAPADLQLSTVYGTGLVTKPGTSHELDPNIPADQEFRTNQPYIDQVGVDVVLDPSLATSPPAEHQLKIQVLNSAGNSILGEGCAWLNNNKFTVVIFPDIRTDPGQVYRFRVTNRSNDQLGIYIDSPTSKSNNVGDASINGAQQPGVIAGYVQGRNEPNNNARIYDQC